LVFEDAPNGAAAAAAANMQCVLIPDGDLFGADVACQHSTQLLSTLMDFRPEDFGLPPFPEESG
jgi:beta-phosphoglucomutase-like phosphatase (HAD superfamily)